MCASVSSSKRGPSTHQLLIILVQLHLTSQPPPADIAKSRVSLCTSSYLLANLAELLYQLHS